MSKVNALFLKNCFKSALLKFIKQKLRLSMILIFKMPNIKFKNRRTLPVNEQPTGNLIDLLHVV